MKVTADKVLEELFKFRIAQLKADSEYATSTISQTVRIVAYGLIALIIPFVSSEPEKVPMIVKNHPLIILVAAIFGLCAVGCDLIQHSIADSVARKQLAALPKTLERAGYELSSPAQFMMPVGERALKWRQHAYLGKIALTGIGFAIVLVTLLTEVYK
jgi:hypothetical protein